jgi:hypothetical protein
MNYGELTPLYFDPKFWHKGLVRDVGALYQNVRRLSRAYSNPWCLQLGESQMCRCFAVSYCREHLGPKKSRKLRHEELQLCKLCSPPVVTGPTKTRPPHYTGQNNHANNTTSENTNCVSLYRVCVLWRVLSNYKIKPSFCDHYMFRPSQEAILRWLFVNKTNILILIIITLIYNNF